MNYAKQLENVTRERTIKPSVFNQENSYSLRAITGQGVIVENLSSRGEAEVDERTLMCDKPFHIELR